MHAYIPVGNPLGYLGMTQTPHGWCRGRDRGRIRGKYCCVCGRGRGRGTYRGIRITVCIGEGKGVEARGGVQVGIGTQVGFGVVEV